MRTEGKLSGAGLIHSFSRSVVAVFLTVVFSGCWIEDDFNKLSPEQHIEKASVIALSRFERSGSNVRCIVSEILKQAPGTTFYYKIGDEVHSQGHSISDKTDYGEGAVLLFEGSPAHVRSALAIHHERITAFGDMPVSTLREMIQKGK